MALQSKRVVIIGAGISGLLVAYWLKKRGFQVTVLEKESHPGGTMRTFRGGGWLVEAGPNSALETTPLFKEIFQELGISDQVVYANKSANKRYILRRDKLHPLPLNPFAFIGSKLWSWSGKLRLLKEPFIGRGNGEESVAEFVERRLGKEILDYAINPFVAGVFAGNPEELSVRSAFPKLYALEEKYGGLIKGMIRGRKERKLRAEKAKDRARLFSFVDGMQTFPDVLGKNLGTSLKLNCNVGLITPRKGKDKSVYEIRYSDDGAARSIEAEVLILSVPAYAAAKLVEPMDRELAGALASIYYPPVAEVFMGFRQEQVKYPLDGFGFLIPEREHRNILGTIWSSSIFPKRAPEGFVALTTFVGGARQPELARRSDRELQEIILQELRALLHVNGSPVFAKITRWDRAIPQYRLGYHNLLQRMDQFESRNAGMYFCSNFRGGISVGDCVMSAERLTDQIVRMEMMS
jgi:oxygen-dependent protoporphyrinogen oxidase